MDEAISGDSINSLPLVSPIFQPCSANTILLPYVARLLELVQAQLLQNASMHVDRAWHKHYVEMMLT